MRTRFPSNNCMAKLSSIYHGCMYSVGLNQVRLKNDSDCKGTTFFEIGKFFLWFFLYKVQNESLKVLENITSFRRWFHFSDMCKQIFRQRRITCSLAKVFKLFTSVRLKSVKNSPSPKPTTSSTTLRKSSHFSYLSSFLRHFPIFLHFSPNFYFYFHISKKYRIFVVRKRKELN